MADQDPSELHLPAEPPPDKDPSVEEIDPDGNVTLLIEGQSRARFLVSSKILSMASPVFARLFGQRFYEGTQMANLSCPTIPLHEDDPVAMRIIIRILHYQEPKQGVSVDAESLAKLAIHCDKYDCSRRSIPGLSNGSVSSSILRPSRNTATFFLRLIYSVLRNSFRLSP